MSSRTNNTVCGDSRLKPEGDIIRVDWCPVMNLFRLNMAFSGRGKGGGSELKIPRWPNLLVHFSDVLE